MKPTRILLLLLLSVTLLTGAASDALAFYHPGTGRWISKDPIGEQGGLNLYGMVNNNPVNFWDLLGLELPAEFKCCKIVRMTADFTSAKEPVKYKVSSDGVWNNPTGRTFNGTLYVQCKSGKTWTASIQTGGMRTSNSTVVGPSAEDPVGDDSATPAGNSTIQTTKGGKGYPINMGGTSRGDITMHYADYSGSHGCPTLTNQDEFNQLVELMKYNHDTLKQNQVDITIQYTGTDQPKGSRGNHRNDPQNYIRGAVPANSGIPSNPGGPR